MLAPMLIDRLQELLAPHYRVERELAGGSMALLYLAEDTRHGRPVVVKVLAQEHAGQFAADRFLREVAIAARLQHPHIVPVLDSGAGPGLLYLVMPFVEGESLRARLAREGSLPVADAVRILAHVADALAYAHRRGIVHRDIKPDNILLSGRHALVTDFGVAKALTAATIAPSDVTTGVALGTPTYMAPEQATAEPEVDARADLYALGVVGYELLAGTPPFTGDGPQQILMAHVLDDPAPLGPRRSDAPPALVALLHRALAKRREDRWDSAEAMVERLEPLATPSNGVEPAPRPGGRAGTWARWLGGVALGVLALLGAVHLTVRPAEPPMRIEERQLTFTGTVAGGAISPDGQFLAFTERRDGATLLQVQDLHGGNPLVVARQADIREPSWSADGTELRYLSRENDATSLYRVPRLGGTPRAVLRAGKPSLSRDGRVAAFVPGSTLDLRLVNMERWDTTVIPLGEFSWYEAPTWSVDGSRLVFAGATGESRRAGIVVAIPALSRAIVVVRDTVLLGSPVLTADNQVLYYLRQAGTLVDLMRLPLTHDGAAAGDPELVLQGIASALDEGLRLTLTDDGRRLMYFRTAMWSEVTARALAPGGRSRPFAAGAGQVSMVRFGPRGRGVAFVQGETDGLSLQVAPSPGAPARELLRFKDSGEPSWSPSGDRIAIPAITAGDKMGLQVVPLEGGPVRTYMLGETGWTAEWLGDSLIAVQHLGNRTLDLLDLRTGAIRPLAGLDTAGWVFSPALGPDGRTLALTWSRRAASGIYLLDLGSAVPRRLTHQLLDVLRWSPDGQRLFARGFPITGDSVRVYAIDVRSGAERLLASYAPGSVVEDIAPDGREVVVREGSRRGDAWVMLLSR